MSSLRSIFALTFRNIQKHFLLLFLIQLLTNTVTHVATEAVATEALKGHPIFLLVYIVADFLLLGWSAIAAYQIISNQGFSLAAQLSLFKKKFSVWVSSSMAGILICMRALFPWIFPILVRLVQLFFVSFIALFEDDPRTNAIEKSKAIAQGKEWKLAGLYLIIVVLTLVLQKLIFTSFNEQTELALMIQILMGACISLLSSTFLITFYKTRGPLTTITPEAEPVRYGKIAMKSLAGAIGGLAWMSFVMTVVIIAFTLLIKKGAS
jgi:hypothetical protein